MLFWYASGVFLGGVLVMGSPTPHRFVILLPPVVIMAAVGLDLLYGVAQRRLGRRLAAVSLLAVLSAYVITSLYVYWEHDTRDIYAADYNTQVGTYVGRFVEECRPGSWVYLLGDSRANDSRSIYYKAMPALMLLTAGRGSDVEPPFDPAKQYEKNAVFVLLPSRVAELRSVAGLLPGGSAGILRNPLGKPLGYVVTSALESADACSSRLLDQRVPSEDAATLRPAYSEPGGQTP